MTDRDGAHPTKPPVEPLDPQELRIRRAWLLVIVPLLVLAAEVGVELLLRGPDLELVVAGLLVATTIVGAALHRHELSTMERRRRAEIEGFARILSGLSRTESPDGIVDAIAHELAAATRADHIVVAHLRRGGAMLEATLFSSGGTVPPAPVVLPFDASRRATGRRERDVRAATRGASGVAIGVGERSGAAVAAGVAASSRAPTSGGPVVGVMTDDWEHTGLGGPGGRAGRLPTDPDRGAIPTGGELTEPGSAGEGAGPGRSHARRVGDRIAEAVDEAFGLKHPIAAPLVTPNGVVGAIVLSRRTAEPWSPTARRLLAGAAVEASAALVRAFSRREAEEQAATDPLTGLPNRRYFEEVCSLLGRRRADDAPVGILMVDIDHFKKLNDRYGHGTGDEVLRAVADAIVGAIREDDVPARFGGEEFVILLRDAAPAVATLVAERVRGAVRGLDLSALRVDRVTVSIGAAVGGDGAEAVPALIERADRALYRAKRAGRDRVVAD